MTDPERAVELTFREEWGRVVGALARAFRDLDLAEDATQEAFAIAASTWPEAGVPDNPGGWIATTARNRALDRVRREAVRAEKHRLAAPGNPDAVDAWEPDDEVAAVDDDLLRLLLSCCHPALDQPSQVALTLRLVLGLSAAEIARAFLVPEPTLAQRLVRAKRKIRAAHLRLRLPSDHELPDRLAPVLAVVQQLYNEGYVATAGPDLDRPDLCDEAIHLARLLVRLLPDEPEVRGLLASLLLTTARRPARIGASGELVPLAEQDRTLWDRHLVEEGRALVHECARRGTPGVHQLRAAIDLVHCEAPSIQETDWPRVVALHDQLLAICPTPVVALNRAVAVAEVAGAAEALRLVDALPLERHHLWHATRAELLHRCGELTAARTALTTALGLTANQPEQRLLARRLAELSTEGEAATGDRGGAD
ncbi:RNA polymerase sigma factor [Nocardioides caldifontis]|uniref:RNA polymerase sigma factor n=1 Tax=Nocardioides caldifontis TaxID=2588938 RepID=UPI0011DF3A09|nr:sigma-70 family RNA polymerase sigma factor [Nocardioides caldifontis]